MDTRISGDIAIVNSKTPLITDAQSALDLIASVGFEHNLHKIAIYKAAISEDFFRLSTGLAGEIVQKFVNYNFRVAIIGDFSHCASKALHDYIYECNRGSHLNFVSDEREALDRLGAAP